jgi:hypothetical protein
MADHAQIFYGENPNDKISDLVGCIKRDSSTFINGKNWLLIRNSIIRKEHLEKNIQSY